jgi:hypothetical protein
MPLRRFFSYEPIQKLLVSGFEASEGNLRHDMGGANEMAVSRP